MATTTGTAIHHNDLLDDLKTFLTTNGWTSLHYTAGATATAEAKLRLNAPGFGGTNQVYVNIDTHYDTASGYYGWALSGALSYYAGNTDILAQAGATPSVYFNTWNSTISYWFYANDRRFIVVAKVNTSYVSCYGGFFLPFASSSEYQAPLYIAGNFYELNSYASSNTRNRMIADPGYAAAYYRNRSGVVIPVRNHDDGTTAIHAASGSRAFMWPHSTGELVSSEDTSTTSSLDWARGGLSYLVNTFSGESVLIPCHIIDTSMRVFPGALDNVYAISGDSRSSEGTITTGGVTYRLFENIGRSTNRDFMAIAEL